MKNNTDEFVDQILESRQKLANDNADLKDLVDSLEKQLSIQRVSQHRELLAFKDWFNKLPEDSDDRLYLTNETISRFKANCG